MMSKLQKAYNAGLIAASICAGLLFLIFILSTFKLVYFDEYILLALISALDAMFIFPSIALYVFTREGELKRPAFARSRIVKISVGAMLLLFLVVNVYGFWKWPAGPEELREGEYRDKHGTFYSY